MRDVIKIFAAASILTIYAVVAPTMVEAVPATQASQKTFTQRLPQAHADAAVSAVSSTAGSRSAMGRPSGLPRFALYESMR